MRTLKEILNQKMLSREKNIVSFLGGHRALNRSEFDRVLRRLHEDSALEFLATLIGSQVWNAAIDSYHNPRSPMEASQSIKVAFAEVIMIWEEINNEFNGQLAPSPIVPAVEFSGDDLKILGAMLRQLKISFTEKISLAPEERQHAIELLDKLVALLPPQT